MPATASNWLLIGLYLVFDTPTDTKLRMHVFVANKGDYYDITDGLPHHNPQ